jgi:cyclic di-GMP phosphodiesterase
MTARKELRASHLGNPDRAPNVLIVDDESGVRSLMARWLEAGGCRVTTAGSAEEAIGRLEETVPAVALCDIRMPGHDGLWLAERIRQAYPETAVIMATGVQDVAPAVKTLRQGVIDYLTKPLSRDRVREAVTRGLEWHEAAWDARRWRESLDQEMTIRRSRLSQTLAGIVVDSDDMVDSMFAMLTLTAPEMHGHGYRVAAMAVSIARILGLPDEALGTIEHGALLHDVGKLTLPEAILRKPAPLTVEELMLVRRHPTIGSELVASVPYLHASVPIVSVADAYDTMTRPRVFRDAVDPSAAWLELERCSGTQFDPLVVEAFRNVFRDICTC